MRKLNVNNTFRRRPYVQFTFCIQMVYPTLITQILVFLLCNSFYLLGTGFALFIRARTYKKIFPPNNAKTLWAINFQKFKVAQGSFISQMEWAPFKSLFWNTNNSTAKLTISFTSDVYLWDGPSYQNMLIYDSDSKCLKLMTTI